MASGVSRSTWAQRRGQPWWAASKDPTKSRGLANGYRSGLEEKNAKVLDDLGVPYEFEKFKIKYVIPEKVHTYTPDFRLLTNGILVETKGKFETSDRAKHLFIQTQHPELDIRFVFQRPSDKIYKGSTTTLGEWATKYGFKWATKTIPIEWTKEPAK
jgi:hypothetical protein